jgi:Xaa-Pro aminopeptidase
MIEHRHAGEPFTGLSSAERDQRWQRIRDAMAKRGVDVLIVSGTSSRWNEGHGNVRYVAGYADPLSSIGYAIFPGVGEGTFITQFQAKRSAYATSWFSDIRSSAAINVTEILAERLSDLGIERATLGLVGSSFSWRGYASVGLPWNVYEEIRRRLPYLTLVDATDIFFELRKVKSDEEVACIAEAARLVDIGHRAQLASIRPGVTERAVYVDVVHAMDAAGAEPPSFLLMDSGPLPSGVLTGDPIPSDRVLQMGDLVMSVAGPKWAGYKVHGVQCIHLGPPTPEMTELQKYGADVFHTCADRIRPGNKVDEVLHAGDDIVERARNRLGRVADTLKPHCLAAGLSCPDGRPDVIQPNMAFYLELGFHARDATLWQHVKGGRGVVATRGEPRYLSDTPIEQVLLSVIPWG